MKSPEPSQPKRRHRAFTHLAAATGLLLLAAARPAAPATPPLAGRAVALDAGHEPPFAAVDCNRCTWMGTGRSSHFYGIRHTFPDHALALAAGPYAGALAEHLLNQDLVTRIAKLLRRAGARVVLTRIARSTGNPVAAASVDTLVDGAIGTAPLPPAALTALHRAGAAQNPRNREPLRLAYADSGAAAAIAGLNNILARAQRANWAAADLAVVIHADAMNDPAVRGRLLFVYHPGDEAVHDPEFRTPPPGRSLDLARTIENRLAALGGIPPGGLYGRDLWYLGTVRMPAVLIEVGRLTNAEDARWLAEEVNRQSTAAAIADAIAAFLQALPDSTGSAERHSGGSGQQDAGVEAY